MRHSAGGSVLFERLSVFEDLPPDEEWVRDTLVMHGRWMIEVIRARDMPAHQTADHESHRRLEAHYLPAGVAVHPGPSFERPSLIVAGRQGSTAGRRAVWGLMDEFPQATFAADMAGRRLDCGERPNPVRALAGDRLERRACRGTHEESGDPTPSTRFRSREDK